MTRHDQYAVRRGSHCQIPPGHGTRFGSTTYRQQYVPQLPLFLTFTQRELADYLMAA
jgi:hypothetical protein